MKKGWCDEGKKMRWFWQTLVKGESMSHVVDGRFQLERTGWGLSLVCHKSPHRYISHTAISVRLLLHRAPS